MRVSVLLFPGSNCDRDAIHAFEAVLGAEVNGIWHKETDLKNPDLVFIPGGFSFGDYLRSGAIARFSPIMEQVQAYVARGGYVMGVCNGFQILCEMQLLPGALLTNKPIKFLCQDVFVRVEPNQSPMLQKLTPGQVLRIPIAHGMGQYFADEATLDRLEGEGQVLMRYCSAEGSLDEASNPNGSLRSIAGICNADGRVFGMMPHPERHVEAELGSEDGLILLDSVLGILDRVN
ncbi:MAG: phosphoribosylformylglycinamidine synthase subunit PurQ [Acidobacteria bacterium]|nr:phosphoribosylformylglycinamidine synthase subunit PurQ [Acidobacteriota bacterium]MCB9396438.1 phosphoribosylformylglycinamidine synthase subunit PurQ [Acidobacteriota bacterium]